MSLPVRILHTSDLHLGKNLCGYSLEEDQRHILREIVQIAREKDVDAIIVAGDIYDTSQPPADAVRIFSDFLHEASQVCPVYAIAGNHDSADRIGFARELLSHSEVYLTGRYEGKAEKYALSEEVDIYLLPFFRTAGARNYFGDESIQNPDQAMHATLANSDIDPDRVNIIVAHQFIAGRGAVLDQSESETMRLSVGTDSLIHSDLFDDFDYGAFGHIHKPQLAGRRELVYCGSPLKYSESEAKDSKHVNVVTLHGKGDVEIEEVPLHPLNEMTIIKGTLDEVLGSVRELPSNRQVYVTLTEQADKANERLSQACEMRGSRLFHLSFDIPSVSGGAVRLELNEFNQLSDYELFVKFYREVNGTELTEEQLEIVRSVTEARQ